MISSFELLFKLQPLPNKYTYHKIPSLRKRPDMIENQAKRQESYVQAAAMLPATLQYPTGSKKKPQNHCDSIHVSSFQDPHTHSCDPVHK